MMDGPLVSVVMAMRNAEATLEPCLRSLQLQTCGDWELLLLDDGSSDRSAAVVESLGDPRIHLIRDGRHRGLPARLNEGVGMARGRFVARMDADDVAYPRRFECQVDYLDTRPEVDLVATRAIIFDGAGRVTGLYPFAGRDHADICSRPWAGFLLPHPAWMGRREWFVAHPYREQAIKAQDQELLLRSYRESRFALIDEILLGYRQEAISVAKSLVGRRIYCEALLRQANGLAGWIMAWRGFGYHALGLVKDLLFAGRANPLRKQPTETELAAFSRIWRDVAVQS